MQNKRLRETKMTKVIDWQKNDCKVNAAEQWGKEPEKRAA
jgi:hypothetical protein